MRIVPRITKPCSQDWAGMKGDEKRRFCEECQLHVHNLPAMSEEEQGELLARRERRCVVYVADDRTITVSSELWLVLHRIWRGWRRGLAFLLVGLALCTTGYGASQPPAGKKAQAKTEDCKQVREREDGKMVMGGVPMMSRPLWQRILFFWEW